MGLELLTRYAWCTPRYSKLDIGPDSQAEGVETESVF